MPPPSITITTNAGALTSLSRVLIELGRDPDGGRLDSLICAYVNASSSWITGYCGREFALALRTVRLQGKGGTRVRLPCAPVVSLTSVLVGDTDVTTDVRVEGDVIYYAQGFSWDPFVVGGIEASALGGSDNANVLVTYTGGYVTRAQHESTAAPITLPDQIEDACVELAVSRWRARGNDKRVQSESHEAKAYSFAGVSVPPWVLQQLADFKRYAQA